MYHIIFGVQSPFSTEGEWMTVWIGKDEEELMNRTVDGTKHFWQALLLPCP